MESLEQTALRIAHDTTEEMRKQGFITAETPFPAWNTEFARRLMAEQDSKYQELIMSVARKCPGETRHQTALRYILNAEKQMDNVACARKND